MPTAQPSNAPDASGEDAAEDLTAAAVLTDDVLDDTPGAAAASGQRVDAGTARNAPIDVPTPHDTASPTAADEARRQAETAEPHPSSL